MVLTKVKSTVDQIEQGNCASTWRSGDQGQAMALIEIVEEA